MDFIVLPFFLPCLLSIIIIPGYRYRLSFLNFYSSSKFISTFFLLFFPPFPLIPMPFSFFLYSSGLALFVGDLALLFFPFFPDRIG
ncbi:hypothetical protein HOY82DRAFT_551985 [Tuber indicum]|nr:hypothetical protein HOY82DRAFT_551985 [Tuber indicum]